MKLMGNSTLPAFFYNFLVIILHTEVRSNYAASLRNIGKHLTFCVPTLAYCTGGITAYAVILHNKLGFPFGEIIPYRLRQFIFYIVVYLISRSGNDFNILIRIFRYFVFDKLYGCLLRCTASVAYTVEHICPVKTVFLILLELISYKIPVT